MKMTTNNITNLVIGFLLTFYIIWNRLLRERIPRAIIPVENYFPTIYLVSFSLILFLFLFFFNLNNVILLLQRREVNQKEEKKRYKIFIKMQEWEQKYLPIELRRRVVTFITALEEGPKELFIFIYNKYRQYIQKPIEWVGSKMIDFLLYNFSRAKIVYWLIFIIPYTLVVLSLLIDIFFFRFFFYFYKAILLLILPLVFRTILTIMDIHGKNLIEHYEIYFKFIFDRERDSLIIQPKPQMDPIRKNVQDHYLSLGSQTLSQHWYFYQSFHYLYNQFKMAYPFPEYKAFLFTFYFGSFTIGFLWYLLILVGLA